MDWLFFVLADRVAFADLDGFVARVTRRGLLDFAALTFVACLATFVAFRARVAFEILAGFFFFALIALNVPDPGVQVSDAAAIMLADG